MDPQFFLHQLHSTTAQLWQEVAKNFVILDFSQCSMAFAVLLPINHYSLTTLTMITPWLILILLLYFLFCPCLGPHIEKEALLNFKKGVTDHSE